ncbi:MAG: hypothetical protein H0T79_00115 [Deltaproteobacteria bacterium]|nr:hypothetical protein [Deltaproteobacteria bacterium]
MSRSLAPSVVLALGLLAAACGNDGPKALDPDLIRVTTDAKMRTDTVGEGVHAELSTFVLVDAENPTSQGAYVTLGGTLADATGRPVSELKPQSLWIPAGERRTYALVDLERKPRPEAVGAQVIVRSAMPSEYPPVAQITGLKTYPDDGKLVVQGRLENPTTRIGRIIVIAAFHDAEHRPMTRPFDVISLDAKRGVNLQFVGPKGAKYATIFIGDETY